MTIPPLTRDIGQAERAMGALLEPLLVEAGLSFPEWTVLVLLEGAGPLTPDELVRRRVGGHVAPEARAAVDRLLSRGLLAPTDEGPRLASTAAGGAAYRPVRRAVDRITIGLYGDLPLADLEATSRTLAEVVRRANVRLAAADG